MNKFLSIVALTVLISAFGFIGASMANAESISVTNYSFETPDLDGNSTDEQYLVGLDGTYGWIRTVESGTAHTCGYQDPASSFFGSAHPLPSPFHLNQIGFVNFLSGGGTARVDSGNLDTLGAGDVYTLNVAVGNRDNSSLADITYSIGLVTGADFGIELGTFASTTLAANGTISDLTYTLDVDTDASGYVGDSIRARIRCTSTGNGQANFDNVRLSVVPEPSTFVLLGTTLLGMLLFWRRRRR